MTAVELPPGARWFVVAGPDGQDIEFLAWVCVVCQALNCPRHCACGADGKMVTLTVDHHTPTVQVLTCTRCGHRTRWDLLPPEEIIPSATVLDALEPLGVDP